MEEAEKGKTFRYLREKREVSQDVKDRLKEFNRAKREILGALKEKDMTVDELGKKLGIGYCNAKQFLNRLNNYGIEREEFEAALKELEIDNE